MKKPGAEFVSALGFCQISGVTYVSQLIHGFSFTKLKKRGRINYIKVWNEFNPSIWYQGFSEESPKNYLT